MKYAIIIVGALLLCIGAVNDVSWFMSNLEVKQRCVGPLSQTANSASVELASERLGIAMDYIEEREWTDGYSHVFIKTEDANVGVWYQNLNAAYSKLVEASNRELTDLEESNLLMKTREVIIDQGQNGNSVVVMPSNITYYPNHVAALLRNILVGLLLPIAGIIMVCYAYCSDSRRLGKQQFTLVEIMIVVAIIGIVIAIFIPALLS